MIRLLATLVCLAALPLALAAPVPTHLFPKDPPLYYPVKKGTSWVSLEGQVEHQYVVSEVEKSESGEETIVTVSEVDGEKKKPYRKMAVSRRGVVWTETAGLGFDEPVCLLRCPVAANEKWEYRTSGPGRISTLEGTMKVVGVEQVEVPAGKFEAVRVEDTFSVQGGVGKSGRTYWFALDVGLVKAEYDNSTWALKSFVPGK